MSSISSMPSRIAEWLSKQEKLSSIKFFTEYPPVAKAVPLRDPIVAVGIMEINITDHFTENDDGVLERDEYCRTAILKIKLSIHLPFSMGGSACHDTFANICDCLTFNSDLEIIKSGCGEMSSDRDTDAIVLNAWLEVSADFCPAQDSEFYFGSFLDKELLCGGHVRDSNIHVSLDEKLKWNNQYITGMYVGTGMSTQRIYLDFTPSAVIVTAAEMPMVHPNFTSSQTYVYGGFCTSGQAAFGIDISNNAFNVRHGSARAVGTSIPQLNSSGMIFSYIAFR